VLPSSVLDFFEAVDHIERIQQGGRYRDGTVHAFAAFFEAFHNDHLVGKIYPSRCEVEGFGNTASGVIEEATKPMVLVADKLGNDISILQTKFSD